MKICRLGLLGHQLEVLGEELEGGGCGGVLGLLHNNPSFLQVVQSVEELVAVALQKLVFQDLPVLVLDPSVGGGHEAQETERDVEVDLSVDALLHVLCNGAFVHRLQDGPLIIQLPFVLGLPLPHDDLLAHFQVGLQRIVFPSQLWKLLDEILELRDRLRGFPLGIVRL